MSALRLAVIRSHSVLSEVQALSLQGPLSTLPPGRGLLRRQNTSRRALMCRTDNGLSRQRVPGFPGETVFISAKCY